MVLSRARAHEDSAIHTRFARQLDHPVEPDLLGTNPGVLETEILDSSSDSARNSPVSRAESPGLFQAELISVHGPALPSDSEHQIYDDFCGDLSLNRPTAGSDSESDSDLSDNEEEIYNMRRGDRIIFQPVQEDFEHSPALSASHPSSDLPLPESDGLFMDHDKQFDNAHEGLF